MTRSGARIPSFSLPRPLDGSVVLIAAAESRIRALRVRRWHIAIGAVRFAVRLRNAIRMGLTARETALAFKVFFDHCAVAGSITMPTQVQSMLLGAGQLVDEADLTDLCCRVGFSGRPPLQFQQFTDMLAIRKRRFSDIQDTSDAAAAFLFLRDPVTHDFSTRRLLALCRDFDLSPEVERWLVTATTGNERGGSGEGRRIDLEEFAALLEPAPDAEARRGDDIDLSLSLETAHRHKLRQEERKVYEGFCRRVGFRRAPSIRGGISLDHSLRLASHAAVEKSNAVMPSPHTRRDHQRPSTAASPPPQHSSRRFFASPQRSGDERSFGKALIVLNYMTFQLTASHGKKGLASDVPLPSPPPCRKRRQSDRTVLERLARRSQESALKTKAATAQTSAFGTSAARFDHDAVLRPLAPPKAKDRSYRRRAATLLTALSTASPSDGPRSMPPVSPSTPRPSPDYATFNPFLGLPPQTARDRDMDRRRAASLAVSTVGSRYSAENLQLLLKQLTPRSSPRRTHTVYRMYC